MYIGSTPISEAEIISMKSVAYYRYAIYNNCLLSYQSFKIIHINTQAQSISSKIGKILGETLVC